MLAIDKIRINDIIFVSHLVGNEPGSHTVFSTDHIHHYQLLYKLSGKAMITFNGKTICEEGDDVRFLPDPSLLASVPEYYADVIERGESINIGFTSDSPLPLEILTIKHKNHSVLKLLFQKLQKQWYYKHDGYYIKCMSLLYEILYEIIKETSNYVSSKYRDIIAPAAKYIDNNFTKENINCNYLAQICSVSYTYLSKLFIKTYGVTPNKYILLKKIHFACDLLNSKGYSINEIAEKSGFPNVYYFSRVFKNTMGICPSQYTKNAHLKI